MAFAGMASQISGLLRARLGTILSPLLVPVVASLVMVAAVVLTRSALAEALPTVLGFCFEILTGVVAYALALWALSRRRFEEAWSFARALVSRGKRESTIEPETARLG